MANSSRDHRSEPSPAPISGNRWIDEPADPEHCYADYDEGQGARDVDTKRQSLMRSKEHR